MSAQHASCINGQTKIAAVFGWPVAHSLSPAMHNAAFGALNLDWVYAPFAVSPEQLPAAVAAIRALGLRGVNATVPHKEALVALMDDLTPEARAIGAVNTILVEEGRLLGHNTDAVGFERTLQRAGFDARGKHALVLGAGGAARAVVYALLRSRAQVVLLNRSPRRAVELLSRLGASAATGALTASEVGKWAGHVQLVVNATSLGMWPQVEGTPWPQEIPFPPDVLLCDLVYNPRRTPLVGQALQAGARCIDGLWMLVYQGAEAFRLWTGQQPDAELMFRAADDQLGGRDAPFSDRR
ncbi:MAG: shikimate dehydrogenase [Chloroflexi bacterium]|nr:shikimate dehydrogenase [Chloroflexota bacterium]